MKTAITPGEILLEDYLIPMGISQNALARALGISPSEALSRNWGSGNISFHFKKRLQSQIFIYSG